MIPQSDISEIRRLIKSPKKRVVFSTFGSLGDLYPYLAIASVMQQRGHAVVIASAEYYRRTVENSGIRFCAMAPNCDFTSPEFQRRAFVERTGGRFLLRDSIFPKIQQSCCDLMNATAGADLLITQMLSFSGPLVAEKTGIPWISTVLAPLSFFSYHDSSVLAPQLRWVREYMNSLNSAINRAARFTTRSWSARVRQLRRELGLSSGADPIYEGQHSPWRVLGLFPRLFAEPQPDWPRNVLLTGFPFWEERRSDTEMESTLRRFLETGTAPVVFTLGTSAVLDPGRFYEESARAVRRIGCRAVFLGASHSALANQAKDLLTLPYTQHDRVFRVACAIVHSGGIGTTASALRSGRPALVVPWGYDQPDNAARLTRMGVARTVGRKRYTARLAAQELERLLGDSITGAIVSGLPFRYSLRMAWRLQLPVLKTAYGKIVTLRPGVVEGDAKSLRAGFWERLRLFFLRPSWKTLPLTTSLIALSGAIQGPPVALLLGRLLDIRWQDVYLRPELTHLWNCIPGAIYSVVGYLIGILPLEYFRAEIRRFPPAVIYWAAAAAALVSAVLANFIIRIIWSLFGATIIRSGAPVERLMLLSLVVTMLVLVLNTVVRAVLVETENRQRALAEAAALAKAYALQAQINPHFFFNTLTTVSALADLDSRAAKELIGQLAELFRYTLSCSRCEMVTLAEELEFVRNYLLIEQARFRRRLRFEMPAQGAGAEIRLPGLTLQPVVENAIRHGIAKRREGGMVKIGLERVDGGGSWVISVANQIAVIEDSPSFDEEIVFVPGHALANTRDRLALAFRGRATLEFFREGEGWVKGGAQTARIAGGFMIRALVVDDEDLPRIQLRNMLAELPDAELLEARDGVDALERIQEVHPDVVFLDIEMPGLNGFEVVEQFSRPPLIVFATAYDEYAVKAFEANAIDYVLKPVHPTRLQQTWERIRAALRQSTSASSQDLRKLLRETRPGAPVRLAAHRNKRIVLVPRRSVVWVGVEDRIVFLHTATDRYLIDRPIGEMEELLKSAGFVRINRSELVNLEHVLEMAPWTSGTWRISLTGGAELNVSRERVRQFKALVGL